VIVVNYLAAGAIFCLGLHTVLTRRNLLKMVMGLSLMEASTYLLLLSMAYRRSAAPPILISAAGTPDPKQAKGAIADPVLQNFCLTAIVIGVAVTAVFLSVVVRLAQHYRTVDADGIRRLRG
jgi:multicomponent Na+:H+ antiporter subunit C